MLKLLTGLPYWPLEWAMRHEDNIMLSVVMFGTMGMTTVMGGLAFGPIGVGVGITLVFAWIFFGCLTEK